MKQRIDKLPLLNEAALERYIAQHTAGYFRVAGDCMEAAGIEDGGEILVDFTHMPRPPKYGPNKRLDPCLCLATDPTDGRAKLMVKQYLGRMAGRYMVSTQYDRWKGGECRMDMALIAEEIYGVVIASYGRDGRLIWERDPEEFPAALSGTPAITGRECQLLPMEDVKRDVPEAAG